MTKVLIIGGGFAGLNAAKYFENKKNIQVTLLDRKNHHLFQPLLYQVATAGLNPADIAAPIRAQFVKAPNIKVVWGTAKEICLQEKKVVVRERHGHGLGYSDSVIEYDYLIVACGANHSYFGKPEWEEFAPGLKSVEQATEIRRRILAAFERAENEDSAEIQQALLTFVVVGGGPTGVEMAGAIADISRTVLVKDFRRIDPSSARVILVEAGSRVLAAFDESLSVKAQKALEKLGVEVYTQIRVTEINHNGVQMCTDQFIPARTVIWAAGVEAVRLKWTPEVETDRAGRVMVGPDLAVSQFSNVFVIGDMAHIISEGIQVPGLAPAAIQAGKYAAKTILSEVSGQAQRKPFKYINKGIMATIGKKSAIVQSGKLKFSGLWAWYTWLFIHIFYLIGFKNRISVMAQWAWSYIFSKRGSRLITDKNWRLGKRTDHT
ncbi:MAG: NAD(P)/FAD-dependent oxidoreductase [Bdellovibrionaceae bacterium]|nr:NAD(P)/FAD-dependent oxidoreductase [Pseudobdellovibrionaceae bacterium]